MRNNNIHYSACVATTLDGKLGPAKKVPFTRISSDEDIRQLKLLRDSFDAVVYGGETYRAWPKLHTGISKNTLSHIIFSRSGNLPGIKELADTNPQVKFLIVGLSKQNMEQFNVVNIDVIQESNDTKALVDAMESWLDKDKTNILLEGGSFIYSIFFRANKIQSLHFTLIPRIIKNSQATPFLAHDLEFAWEKVDLKIKNIRAIGNEVFIHYKVTYSD